MKTLQPVPLAPEDSRLGVGEADILNHRNNITQTNSEGMSRNPATAGSGETQASDGPERREIPRSSLPRDLDHPQNVHEQFARYKRATALANVIEATAEVRKLVELVDESPVELAKRMNRHTPEEHQRQAWVIVAEVAKIRAPSVETQALTIQLLQERFAMKAQLMREALL